MNYWIDRNREALLATLERVDTVLLNDEEIRMLTGESNLIRGARAVLELGPSLAVVKKGEHGCLVVSPTFLFSAPAYPVERVCDPTGAGDSFAGGFVGFLAAAEDPADEGAIRQATVYGTVLASFAVESFGLDGLARAERSEIEARFSVVRELVRF
jgi:sugar/nucleoside kinase (ribokinase family)